MLRQVNTDDYLEALTPPADPDDAADRELIDSGERRKARILDEWEAIGASAEWVRGKLAAIDAELDQARRRIAGRARRSAVGDLAGLTRDDWDVLPLSAQRAAVAELLPVIRISRTTRRGKGFDAARVSLA